MVLDRYRVVEQIASGGHSVVFRGTDERLSRPVCIKVFSGLGGESGVGRTSYEHFVQEAFALSRLTHPNTLRIYDFGHLGPKDADGMPLQVCEFMNGGTLSQVVREEGKQSLAETARVVTAMCAALAEAHALGIVHRDIKPQNILFGTVGGVRLSKLADFGIAKWSADRVEGTEKQRAEDTQIVAGQKLAMYSPSWAAPEQLAGQPVSPATDIYSLACVAVYMLSGKAIFADEDVYAGYKKRRHADELVRDALKPLGISPMVISLLTRALAFDPKRRLAKVDELASDLRSILDPGNEESGRVPAPSERTVPLEPLTPTSPVSAITPPPAPLVEPDQVPAASAPTPPPTLLHTYKPLPTVRNPWMATATAPTGHAHPMALVDLPTIIGDRRVHFRHMTDHAAHADLTGLQGNKIRVSFLDMPSGRSVHVKGLSCFVAPAGGRPSPALNLEQPTDIALVTPRAQEVGHVRVVIGTVEPNQIVFAVGSELVAVRSDDCSDPILFDFGPGSDAYFVYTRGRPIPKSPIPKASRR